VKAITLRNLPVPLTRAVRERAAKYHVSLNKAVIQLLEESLGNSGPGPGHVHDDLDHLIGSWSRQQGRAAERHLAEQRRIEPELWR
jgi:plasmid stability protein